MNNTNAAEKHGRPSWDEYFLEVARVVSSRSSCFRNKVGAVVVREKAIISTGYNGAPSGQKNCAQIGFCYRNVNAITSGTQLEKCRAVGSHAESNAVVLAARNGNATNGATIFIHGHVKICNQCKAIIANAGIKRVILRTPNSVEEYFPADDWIVHPIDE